MKHIPSKNRPSTQVLRELLQIRLALIETETRTPYMTKDLDPLMRKDYWLSDALVRFISYEYGLNLKFPVTELEEDETF